MKQQRTGSAPSQNKRKEKQTFKVTTLYQLNAAFQSNNKVDKE